MQIVASATVSAAPYVLSVFLPTLLRHRHLLTLHEQLRLELTPTLRTKFPNLAVTVLFACVLSHVRTPFVVVALPVLQNLLRLTLRLVLRRHPRPHLSGITFLQDTRGIPARV